MNIHNEENQTTKHEKMEIHELLMEIHDGIDMQAKRQQRHKHDGITSEIP
jgi:hypothetical protein